MVEPEGDYKRVLQVLNSRFSSILINAVDTAIIICYLERLYECPKKSPDTFSSTEKFDKSHDSEKTKKIDGNHVCTRL